MSNPPVRSTRQTNKAIEQSEFYKRTAVGEKSMKAFLDKSAHQFKPDWYQIMADSNEQVNANQVPPVPPNGPTNVQPSTSGNVDVQIPLNQPIPPPATENGTDGLANTARTTTNTEIFSTPPNNGVANFSRANPQFAQQQQQQVTESVARFMENAAVATAQQQSLNMANAAQLNAAAAQSSIQIDGAIVPEVTITSPSNSAESDELGSRVYAEEESSAAQIGKGIHGVKDGVEIHLMGLLVVRREGQLTRAYRIHNDLEDIPNYLEYKLMEVYEVDEDQAIAMTLDAR